MNHTNKGGWIERKDISEKFTCATGLAFGEIDLSNIDNFNDAQNIFAYCYGITEVTLSDNLTRLPNRAFYNDVNLASVNVPNNLGNSISEGVLYNTHLKEIRINENNTNWMWMNHTDKGGWLVGKSWNNKLGTWGGCLAFGEINLTAQGNINYISGSAFKGCGGITKVNIDSSIVRIEGNSFTDCYSLNEITLNKSSADNIEFRNNSFTNTNRLKKIILNQDLDHIDTKPKTELVNAFKEKFNGSGVTTNPEYSTWFDSTTKSPTEALDIHNLNIDVETIIGNGFKAWKDVSRDTRVISVECETSNNKIVGTAHFNSDFTKIITNFKATEEISDSSITFTPKLHFVDITNVIDKYVYLQSGTLHFKTNNSILVPILGGVFGGIVVIGLIAGGIAVYKKKKNNKSK